MKIAGIFLRNIESNAIFTASNNKRIANLKLDIDEVDHGR